MKFVETKNELTEEVGGYQHVVVLQNMKVVDGDLVDVLKRLPRGTVSGDCIQDFASSLFFCFIAASFYNRLLDVS